MTNGNIYGLWYTARNRWLMAGDDDHAIAAYLTKEDAEAGLAFWSEMFEGWLEIRVLGTHNTPQGEEQQ